MLKKHYYLAISIGIIILIAGLGVFLDSFKTSIFEFLKEQRTFLLTFIEQTSPYSEIILFILIMILVLSPIPFAGLAKVVGGFAFGTIYGSIVNIVATTLGCVIGYYIGKYFFGEEFYKKYSKKIKKIDKEFEKHGFFYLMILRLLVIIPFFLINTVAGMSRKISLKNYTLATIVSITPMSIVYAYGGSKLATLSSLSELFTPQTIVTLGLIILFIGGTVVLRKRIEKKEEKIIS